MTATGASRRSSRRPGKRNAALVACAAALLVIAALPPGRAHAAGPWKGQVVDAENGRPLPDVVVLAVWWLRSPGAVHERREFHEAHEIVTDGDGRFVIPEVRTFTLNPFTRIQGPDLKIFKGGYGQWQFRGEPTILASDIVERNAWLEHAWKRFESDGVVIELPPLKTREERRRFRGLVTPVHDVPHDRTIHFMKAIDEEDRLLGIIRPDTTR
jgi:hypothetical protein